MNKTIYLVNQEDGLVSRFEMEDFIYHFNHNEYLSNNYNAFLSLELANQERENILAENKKNRRAKW